MSVLVKNMRKRLGQQLGEMQFSRKLVWLATLLADIHIVFYTPKIFRHPCLTYFTSMIFVSKNIPKNLKRVGNNPFLNLASGFS